MNQAFYLSSLQKIDRRLDQIASRLSDIKKIIDSDKTIANAENDQKIAKTKSEKARLALKDIENRCQQIQIKINQSESSLYGGKVRNPKELQDLEKEIASLKRTLSGLEDQQIDAMVSLEEAEKQQAEFQLLLQSAINHFATRQSILVGERDVLIHEQEKLMVERNAVISQVSKDQLAQYDHLRKTKGGIAVTTVDDEACLICGASLTPADIQLSRSPHNIIFCPSCGRIIYGG